MDTIELIYILLQFYTQLFLSIRVFNFKSLKFDNQNWQRKCLYEKSICKNQYANICLSKIFIQLKAVDGPFHL